MEVRAANTSRFPARFSPLPSPPRQGEGAKDLTRKPRRTCCAGVRVLDSQEREWRNEHRSVKFELMTFVQVLHIDRYSAPLLW